MELKDLKLDDYYYAEYTDNTEFAIVKGTDGKRPNIYVNSNKDVESFWAYNQASARKNIRLATPQEIHWLDCCINNDKFISYEDVMLTFIELINYQQDSEYNNLLIKLLTT